MGDELQRADKGFSGILKSLTMSRTDRANQLNRSVVEYLPCPVDAFFNPENGVYNTIISGGDNQIRVNAMVAQAMCAVQNSFPVIILHEGNHTLARQMKIGFASYGKYLEISPNSPCFEPFYGLNELEIANQILETAPKEFDIKFSARYYIEGISQLLKRSGKHLSFKMFSTCPHALVFDKVDDLYNQSAITDAEEQEIKSKLMMGQSESYKLDTFLASLQMQISSSMYVPRSGHHPANIISALQRGYSLCVDISSVTNKLFIDTLVYQLKLALTKGMQYVLIVDSLPLNVTEKYTAYVKSPTDKISKLFAADDLYALIGGDEKAFSALVGDSQILIVMGHTSGNSATKWAEVFGQYDKFEQSYSTSRGASKKTPFSILSSPNYQNSVTVNKCREFVIKPEAIMRMEYGEAYVLSTIRGELAHLVLNG